jgi:hypothetical protein
MAIAKFNLRNTNSDNEIPIYLKFHYKKKVFTHGTGIKTLVKNWDFKKQRIRGYNAESKIFNKHLDFLSLEINTAFFLLKQSGKGFSIKDIETEFFKRIGISKNTVIVAEYAERLDHIRKDIGLKSPLTTLIVRLNKFKKGLTFEDLTHDFYYSFLNYILDEGLKRSYFNHLIMQLKIVGNDAVKNEVTTKTDFKYFKRLKVEADNIHIPIKRVGEMYYYENGLTDAEIIAKDSFVLACCIGVRFSDWHKIKKENILEIKGQLILSIKDQKRDNYLAVPLNLFPYTILILEKYNYKLPKLRNNVFNKHIKTVAEKIGWTEIIPMTVYKKQVAVKTFRFCDIIGSHTARRSFVTNLKSRFSDSEIMKMTGHKSTKSFNKYDKQTAEENAVLIAEKTINTVLKVAK